MQRGFGAFPYLLSALIGAISSDALPLLWWHHARWNDLIQLPLLYANAQMFTGTMQSSQNIGRNTSLPSTYEPTPVVLKLIFVDFRVLQVFSHTYWTKCLKPLIFVFMMAQQEESRDHQSCLASFSVGNETEL